MKHIKLMTSTLILASLMMLSGCSSDTNATTTLVTPDDNTTASITASVYTMTLDVNKSAVSSDWKVSSATAGVSASVTTQGAYGNCVINDTSITYTKTTETNSTDSCTISINNAISLKVSINSLYWKQVASGFVYTVAIKSDGTLWSWGRNDNGQLGDGTTTNRDTPTQEDTNSTNWSLVSAYLHTVAIKDDGTLWSWGRNTYGELGDNTTTQRHSPTQEFSNDTNWSSVSIGVHHTVALKKDGTLWAWGYNTWGQLGDGTTINRDTPRQEASLATSWSIASAGKYNGTVAIKSDGTLWSWGDNDNGRLGDGTTTDRQTPTQEATLSSNWNDVKMGQSHTVALKDDGTLWSWGLNSNAQLGDGTTVEKLVPTQENTNTTSWSNISANFTHTLALKSDGTLWAWGRNDEGQLGDNSIIDRSSPIQEVTFATSWSDVSANYSHSVALKSDGTIWVWGTNVDGEFGNGTTATISLVPIKSITRN